ncbi:MAG: hypothetical protein AAFV47_09205 [Pseudomonadota bacterium]
MKFDDLIPTEPLPERGQAREMLQARRADLNEHLLGLRPEVQRNDWERDAAARIESQLEQIEKELKLIDQVDR